MTARIDIAWKISVYRVSINGKIETTPPSVSLPCERVSEQTFIAKKPAYCSEQEKPKCKKIVANFNQAIAKVTKDGRFDAIVKKYDNYAK